MLLRNQFDLIINSIYVAMKKLLIYPVKFLSYRIFSFSNRVLLFKVTLLFAALFANPVFAQTTIFFEDFEGTGADTYTVNTTGLTGALEWDYGNAISGQGRLRMFAGTGFAKNGTRAATMDRDPSGTTQINYLILNLDMSAYTVTDSILLNFSFMDHGDETSTNDVVWVRGNNGAAWINIYNLLPGTATNGVYNDIIGLDISGALAGAGQNYSASFQLRFGQEDNFPATSTTGTDGITFDDIELVSTVTLANDAGITQITAPGSGCGSAVYEDVTVIIRNFGLDTIFTLDASYTVNGGAPVTESVSTTILPGNNFTYTFSSQANLGAFGTYNFDAWTTLAGDSNNLNDSTTNYQVIRDSVMVQNICIVDFITDFTWDYVCNFTDLCSDDYSYGIMTQTTSLPITIAAPTVDSIAFNLYYSDCGVGTDFILDLNGVQIGTYTDNLGECTCNPSTHPLIYTVTDTALLNSAWSDTNTLGVIHNGSAMAVAGYSATIYSRCTLMTALAITNDTSICAGGSVNLTVTVTDSAGFTAPYIYLWSPAAGLSCTTCQSPIASPAATTAYMVMVTDSTGTQDSAIVTITVLSALPTADAGPDASMCIQESTQLNASGGTSYSWSPVTGLNNPNISNPMASPTATTNYEVTVSNACGSDIDSVTVVVNPLPTVDAGPDTSVCIGGSVQLNATGGTSYLWISGAGLSDTTISNPMASPLATTTYTVVVTDVNGCVNIDSVTVSVGGGPIIAASTRDSICAGDTAQLYAYSCTLPLFEDGFEDGTYNQWTDVGGGYTITATTSTAAVGNYSLQLQGGSFTGFDGVYTTFNPGTPDYVSFYINSASTFDFDGFVVIGDNNTQTNNGIMNFYADWSGLFSMNGITSTYNANQWYHIEYINIDFGNTTFDYYIDGVLIQAGVLFGSTTSTDISEIHLFNYWPSTSIANYDDIFIGAPCSGIDTTLSYSWTPTTGLSDPNIANPIASPTTTTSYVVVASGGGCSASDTVTIVTTPIDVDAISSTPLICAGDTTQLSATSNISGTTYSWSPATGLSCTSCPSPSANPSSTTTYYVTGTSGSCSDMDSVLITVGTGSITPSCAPATFGYCCGMGIYNVTFNTINNTTPDGIEGYQDYSCTYGTNVIVDQPYAIYIQTGTGLEEDVRVWIDYNNDGVFDNNPATELVFSSDDSLTNHSGTITIPSSAMINTPLRMRVGSDYYINTSPQPCVPIEYGQFEDYTVIVLPNTIPPVADLTSTILDMCQGIVSFTDQSLYNPTSWSWDFGDNSGLSTLQNPFYTYSASGTYTVTLIATNPYGSDTITQQITINSLSADFTVSSNTVDIGENVIFTDNSPGATTWDWDFGDGFSSSSQNTFHDYVLPGTYTVVLTVTNSSGCVGQKALQIVVLDCSVNPQTGSITGPVNVNASATGNYSVTFNSGSTYNWTIIGGNQTSGGQTNFITVQWDSSGLGQITVVETDSIGCTGDPVTLIVTIGPVGIDDQSASWQNQLKVYPNPNTGEFILDMNLPENTNLSIYLYNFTGQLIQSEEIGKVNGNYIQQMDLSGYAKGIYYVQARTDNSIITRKIIFQ